MKNLHKHCVEVANTLEKRIAITFYQRACHKAVSNSHLENGKFVGIGRFLRRRVEAQNKVFCGNLCWDETPIPFSRINDLADTPSRKQALAYAFKKHGYPVKDNGSKPVIAKSKAPIVQFKYPSRKDSRKIDRRVQVIEFNDHYLKGIDLNENKFKQFRRDRIVGGAVFLSRYSTE